jgi:cyclomaltodextrinase / maltogenic alpha-amylase / neopullulanase
VASWAEHAIWWHVYPLGFTGAEKTSQIPDPDTPPGDPALVPAYGRIVLDA